jgi:hypothetical protein
MLEIRVPHEDMRGTGGSRSIDDLDGNLVGQILFGRHPKGRTIILFGKYQGNFTTTEECP